MKSKAILFDLDGTLLRMEENEFLNHYLPRLCQTVAALGYTQEEIVRAMWKGVDAIVNSDGAQYNHDTFWQVFSAILGEDMTAYETQFDAFYREGAFHETKEITKPNPQAKMFIEELKRRHIRVILATNPLFPACAVQTRLSWIDLSVHDFEQVTTYENSRYCKPAAAYYQEILQTAGLQPRECMMIGNSIPEDILPAQELGMETFLITEYASGDTALAKHKGTFSEMMTFVRERTM